MTIIEDMNMKGDEVLTIETTEVIVEAMILIMTEDVGHLVDLVIVLQAEIPITVAALETCLHILDMNLLLVSL